MSKCVLCSSLIPTERKHYKWPNKKVIYCSGRCIKRAYYLKNHRGPSFLRQADIVPWFATESGKGMKWEIYTSQILNAEMNNSISNGMSKHFDLNWNGKMVEVKSANLYKRTNKRGKPVDVEKQIGWWRFDRGTKQQNVDFFFCIGLVNNVPIKHFLIPNTEFGKRGITLSPTKSKYDKFIYKPY